jgi:hypothetical protein
MRLIPWLVAILIGSAALGVGCGVGFLLVTGSNLELETLFLIGIDIALVVLITSTVLLFVAISRT